MTLSMFFRVFIIRIFSIFFWRKRSKAIFYHDIHSDKRYTDMSTSIELFKKHIKIIKNSGYEIVSEISKPYAQIEICFDDAFLGLYKNIEFLKTQNIAIHLFVISSHFSKDNFINRKQLLELDKLNFIKISSHTHTHRVLNNINNNEIESELKVSKEILENLISDSVDSICYPEGKFDDKIIEIAKKVGYKNQYSSIPGFFSDKFKNDVSRRSLVQFAGEKEFKAIIRGGDNVLAFWYTIKHFNR